LGREVRIVRRNLTIAVLCLGASIIVPIAAPGAGAATVAQGEAADMPAILDRQEQIHRVTDPIRARVERENIEGFAGVIQSDEALSFTMYWKGSPPNWVRQAVESAQGPKGTLEEAPFSAAEIDVAAKTLIRAKTVSSYRINSVIGRSDGSGLTAQVMPVDGHRPSQAELKSAAVLLSSRVARPVVAIAGYSEDESAASRNNDVAPWYSGGARDRGAMECSLGFAIRLESNSEVRLLSSSHCTGGSGDPVYSGTGNPIGNITIEDPEYDSELINPANVSGYGRVWDGWWATTNSVPVVGSTFNDEGDYVVTSGSVTGTHKAIRIVNASYYTNNAALQPGNPYFDAGKGLGEVAVGKGDSGGAVYNPTSTGDAMAAGTISGYRRYVGDTNFLEPCGTTRVTTECSRRVLFKSHMANLNRWKANTVTG
jgi:hypothetical protein